MEILKGFLLKKTFKIEAKDLPKYTYTFIICNIIESVICHAMGVTFMKSQYAQTKEMYFYIGICCFSLYRLLQESYTVETKTDM